MGLSDHWNSIARLLGAPGAPQSEKPELEPAPSVPETGTVPPAEPQNALSSPQQTPKEPLAELFENKPKKSGWNSLSELLDLPPEVETSAPAFGFDNTQSLSSTSGPTTASSSARPSGASKRAKVTRKYSRPSMFRDEDSAPLDDGSTGADRREASSIDSPDESSRDVTAFEEGVPPVIPGWESAEFGGSIGREESEFGKAVDRDGEHLTSDGPRRRSRRGRRGRSHGSSQDAEQRDSSEGFGRDAVPREPLDGEPDLPIPPDPRERSTSDLDEEVIALRRGPRRRRSRSGRDRDSSQLDRRDEGRRDQGTTELDPRDIDPRDIDPRDIDPRDVEGDEGWDVSDGSRSRPDRSIRGDRSDRSARGGRRPVDSPSTGDGEGDRDGRYLSETSSDERVERSSRGRRRRRDEGSPRKRPAPSGSETLQEESTEPVVVHKNIPTWLDAVDILIQANMASRRRDPSRRGNGRGR